MKILSIIAALSLLVNLNSKPKVLLVGDSMAEGINPFIQQELKDKVTYKSVYKRGTTVPYWNSNTLLDKELDLKPDIILVSLGTNDLKTKPSNFDSYAKFNSKLINSGAKIYWIIPPEMPFNNEDIIYLIEHPEPPIEKIDCSTLNLERAKDKVHLTIKGYRDWSKCISNSLPI